MYAASQWGMLVVLAKLTNTETLGRFALGLAITAPIIIFSQLQLNSIQATDAEGEFELGHYLALRLLTTTIAMCFIGGVVICGNYSLESALVIMAVGFSKAIESVSYLYYGQMQRHERMDYIACSKFIKGPLTVIALVITLWITGDIFWGIIGYTLIWTLTLLFYDQRNAIAIERKGIIAQPADNNIQRWVKPIFNRQILLRLGWLTLPLGTGMALHSLSFNMPRFFIESNHGEGELGIFAALAYFIMAGTIVVAAIGQSALPRLAAYYASGDTLRYKTLMRNLIGIGVLIGATCIIVAVVMGEPLLGLLYGPEYADRAPVLVWLMLAGAALFVASFLGYSMTATRHFTAQLPLLITVALTVYTLSRFLIPNHSLMGAALSLAAGAVVQIVGSGVIVSFALARREKR